MNLQEFIQKYSTIPNQFINDFYSLQNITDDNDYSVNLDIVVKWLKSKKNTLKTTIVHSYIENIDYTIKKTINKGRGGSPTETIMLTSDCFKRLCMVSKTTKAEEVRNYFIQLEKFIDKYKNYIIEGLKKRVEQIERKQKPIIDNVKSGIIYVLKTDEQLDNLYKIGKTKKFKNRLKTHNTSHADNVEIILQYETENIDKVESCLKLFLKEKQYRKRKEFYTVDIDIIKNMINKCEELNFISSNPPKKFKHIGGFYIMIDRN